MSNYFELNELKTKLEQQLYFIEQQPGKALYQWIEAVRTAADVVTQLKYDTQHYTFEEERHEIKFYKEVVPWFYSQVICYQYLFCIEAKTALCSANGERKFIKRKLIKFRRFLKDHHRLHVYIKLGETNRDTQCFLKRNQDQTACSKMFFLIDQCCTEHVYRLSKIIAPEWIKEHFEAKLAEPGKHAIQQKELRKGKPPLRWTGSKTDLIELIYALHSSHLFNDSKIPDVRLVAEWRETACI